MILRLFLTFLEIGTVSFGGGYGMISLIREKVLANQWLSEEEFVSFIAVSESTPGPLAVNMATFIGASRAGLAGAFFATLGVVLPAFLIILCIAALIRNLLKFVGVKAFLSGVRPCVVALILSTGITMLLDSLLRVTQIGDPVSLNLPGILILVLLAATDLLYAKCRKKRLSPILLILLSAILGLVFC